MVFHWSLSDSKSPQVSRTRLRILSILSNAVVWIVSTHPSTSKSSRPFNNPLVTVPNAPITTGTIVTFMFHSFFNSLARLIIIIIIIIIIIADDNQEHDIASKVQYLELCQEMGVHPVSGFVRDIKNDHISLPYYGLGQGAIKPITVVLRVSLLLLLLLL